MSGPKAFRVITRAEVLAICRRDLARLDAAVENWISACERIEILEKGEMEKVHTRRSQLHSLLNSDRFGDLQRQVAAEIVYLRTDAERRTLRAAEEAARARLNLRRSRAAAEALLSRLDEVGIDIPVELRRELAVASSHESLDAAVAKGLLLFASPHDQKAVTERQRDLAQALGAGESRITLEEWLSQQPQIGDRALERVDALLAEMTSLGMDPSSFAARVSALENEAPEQRALKADSLLLDLAAVLRVGRETVRLLESLRERRAELSEINSAEATSLLGQIDKAIGAPSSFDVPDLLKRSDQLIETEMRAMANVERRRAVLEGLASLGYEVSEGMTTGWVKDGRVVLRKPAFPGYGVELQGAGPSDLLQVRAVALGDPTGVRDSTRDRDMEAIWCGEFDRLKALVAQNGGAISIEFARAVGEFPLKVVPDLASEDERDTVGRAGRYFSR